MSTSEMDLPCWPELAALYETPPELSSCLLYYVDGLRMRGLAAEHPDGSDRAVRVAVTGSGRQEVSVTSEKRALTFSAAASAAVRTRVYLQGAL
ncbi:hypothetical protein ACFYYS_30720 [Streptomyces sp. NPDC002120]|uniref:hypothetical protein n=1 Tax=Streptomyces sp. NPDC002120 TaxID=3364631 RepID=UPI0036AAFA13